MFAFLKKEWMETVRTGKLIVLVLLFALFGIMNPAIAKLTPWLMELLTEQMAENGLAVTGIQVDAMTSWTQFFKNIPIALIIFLLLYSDFFTKEYQRGTLLLLLTKGLARYKVVLAKTVLLMALWSFCYWLCFTITYGYNAYFWDNGIAAHLWYAAACWWLFGIWVLSLLVFFSALFKNQTEVVLCAGGVVLLFYLAGMLPKVKEYLPIRLASSASLLADVGAAYGAAVSVTIVFIVFYIAVSIPMMNKKQI